MKTLSFRTTSKFVFVSLVTLAVVGGCSSAPTTKPVSEEEQSSQEVTNQDQPQQDQAIQTQPNENQSTHGQVSAKASGALPVIVNPRVVPDIVTLNQNLEAPRPLEIYADVKSFGSELDKVKFRLFFSPETEHNLRFFKRPVDVDMKHVGGSTWRAELSDSELKRLAINGKSLKYEGHVIAQNEQGQVTVSADPIVFTVQAQLLPEGEG